MIKEKELKFQMAYTELYEIFKLLSKEQLKKIPRDFILNIKNKRDLNHGFVYDESKEIFEQNLMVETQALLVKIYEKFLAPEEEKELWEKYDRICFNKIEEEKSKKYNVNVFNDNIFKKEENNNEIIESDVKVNNSLVKIGEIPWYRKIINKIISIFKRKL